MPEKNGRTSNSQTIENRMCDFFVD